MANTHSIVFIDFHNAANDLCAAQKKIAGMTHGTVAVRMSKENNSIPEELRSVFPAAMVESTTFKKNTPTEAAADNNGNLFLVLTPTSSDRQTDAQKRKETLFDIVAERARDSGADAVQVFLATQTELGSPVFTALHEALSSRPTPNSSLHYFALRS